MKIFLHDDIWFGKVNFVDENNVFVGFDMFSQCCENYGWFFSDKKEMVIDEINKLEKNSKPDISDYIFDKSFFEKHNLSDYCDEFNIVIFKLISNNKKDLFLHLYNFHNGYYHHGFIFADNNEKITKGDL